MELKNPATNPAIQSSKSAKTKRIPQHRASGIQPSNEDGDWGARPPPGAADDALVVGLDA
jgi:hypothetical protein